MYKKILLQVFVTVILVVVLVPWTRNFVVQAADSLWEATGTNIQNLNSGKVMLGSTSSSSLELDVRGNDDASGATNTGIVEVGDSLRLDKNEIITNTDSALYLQTGNNGDLRVDDTSFAVDASTNRVGIGKTSPASKLHVYQNDTSTSTTTGLTIEQDGSGDAQINYLLTGSTRWVMGTDNSDTNAFKIGQGAGWGSGEYIVLEADGDICIGNCE